MIRPEQRSGATHYNDMTMLSRRFTARSGPGHPPTWSAPGRRTLAAALVMLLAAPAAGAQAAPTASELASRIQARYNTIRDFTADFTQQQTTPLLPKPVTERGTVRIKKPGRMRWTYTTGDHNEVVSDGTMIYAYFPEDRYVSPTPMPRDDEASTALLFLTGRGDLTRDFTASVPTEHPDGEWRLVLRPRAEQADFETLTLDVDRTTLAFRGLAVLDDQGGTSAFRFTNLRENRGLSDREFEFTIPRGVEVR